MNIKYKHFYGINNPGEGYLKDKRADMPLLFDTVYNAAVRDVCSYLELEGYMHLFTIILNKFLIEEDK